MSEFYIFCPQCRLQMAVQTEWIGMEVECPGCAHHFIVNSPSVNTTVPPQMMNQQYTPPPSMNQQYTPPPSMNQQYTPPPSMNGNYPGGYNNMNMGTSDWYVSYEEAQTISKYFTIMWICFVASFFTCGLAGIAGTVFGYILLYKFWKIVPYHEARDVTPEKAVFFLFIPFFNLYWVFVAYHRLAQIYKRYTSAAIDVYAIIFCVSMIFLSFSGLLLGIFGLLSVIPYIIFHIMLFYELKNIVLRLAENRNGNQGYGMNHYGNYNNRPY